MDILGFDVPIWFILTLLAILFYTVMMSRDFLTFRRMGIPGPTPLPILGNLLDLILNGFRALDIKSIRKYGKVYGFYDMRGPSLVTADKDMLREILVKQFSNFPERNLFDGFNGDVDNSILHTKGEQWKHGRSVISPTFSTGKLRQMAPLIIEACDTLVKTTRTQMRNGEDDQVSMKSLFGAYTMDVISSTAFGIRVDSQSDPDDLFVQNAKNMSNITLWMMMILFFPALKPLFKKLNVSVTPKDSMKYFRKITTQLLEERKESKEVGRTDFLQLMMDAQEGQHDSEAEEEVSTDRSETCSKQKGLTFEEILGNAELFFGAGYETTSITLTMTAYNLATNPECQEKLRQEISERIGSKVIDYDNIQKLHYLDMCLHETLRMYPPAMRLERLCVKTTKVKDITIPAGMIVSVPVYAMHHDPEVWEKPDVFNPNRFSACEKANHDQLDYLPFGYGPRNCIGMRLALLEAKMAIAYIVRNFRLCVGSKTDIPPKLEDVQMLKPIYLWLKIEEIK